MGKYSPWLVVGEDPMDGELVLYSQVGHDRAWAEVFCLSCYYTLPKKIKRLRFVKGEHPEALLIEPISEIGSCLIIGCRAKPGWTVAMMDQFLNWLGKKKQWVRVEYEY